MITVVKRVAAGYALRGIRRLAASQRTRLRRAAARRIAWSIEWNAIVHDCDAALKEAARREAR